MIACLLMKKIIALGLTAVLLTFALVLASCGLKCVGGGGCYISADSSAFKWCGTDAITRNDSSKATGCDVFKKWREVALGNTKKASCDC